MFCDDFCEPEADDLEVPGFEEFPVSLSCASSGVDSFAKVIDGRAGIKPEGSMISGIGAMPVDSSSSMPETEGRAFSGESMIITILGSAGIEVGNSAGSAAVSVSVGGKSCDS